MDLNNYAHLSPEKLLVALDLDTIPVDLDKICKKLHVNCEIGANFDKDHSGEIKFDPTKKMVSIWVNALDTFNRQRFTLAHEIGHLIHDVAPQWGDMEEHFEIIDDSKKLRRDGRQHPIEYRANDFAARLLMPRKHIVGEGRNLLNRICEEQGIEKVPQSLFIRKMAKLFQVSEQAMEIRLKILRLIKRDS